MTKPTEEIARLAEYNTSSADVPHTMVGPDGYGYVEELPRLGGDVATVANWLADEVLDIVTVGVRWIPQSIRTRATGNIAASALVNGAVVNGVTLQTGDHVFRGLQTDPKENGIFTVVASGSAARATFADSAAELSRIGFVVREGVVGTGERWTLPMGENDINLGGTDLTFSLIGLDQSAAQPRSPKLDALVSSPLLFGPDAVFSYTGGLGLSTESLQSPIPTNAAIFLKGTTTTTNQNFLVQLELISDTVSNTLGGAATLNIHTEATANSGPVWAAASSVKLAPGFAFGTYSAFGLEQGINNLAGDYSDIGASAAIGVSLNGLGYRNSAALYVNNMQMYILATATTSSGNSTLTFSGGVPDWFKVGGVITNLDAPTTIPANAKIQSKTSTTIVLDQAVTGAGVAIGNRIQVAQPLWYQGIKFAPNGILQYSINDRSDSATSLHIGGSHTYGVDLSTATFGGAAIRLGAGSAPAAGIAYVQSGIDYPVLWAHSSGIIRFGNANFGTRITGNLGWGSDPSASTALVFSGSVNPGSGNALVANFASTLFPGSGAAGIFFQAGGTVNTSGNTIAGAYGAYLAGPLKAGGGTITNVYSLFLEAPSSGTNNYSLRAAGRVDLDAAVTVAAQVATPSGGSTSARLLMGTTSGFGLYYGSGAPTVSAAQGSLYLRSDGSSTSTRLYVNTNGSTTWTNVTTAA